jgi:hypothetical protein
VQMHKQRQRQHTVIDPAIVPAQLPARKAARASTGQPSQLRQRMRIIRRHAVLAYVPAEEQQCWDNPAQLQQRMRALTGMVVCHHACRTWMGSFS